MVAKAAFNGSPTSGGTGGAYGGQLATAQNSYADILKGYQDRQTALSANLESYGQNQLTDANRYYDQQSAQATQSARSRGLSNSTISDSLQAGVNAQRDYALRGINSSLSDQRLQLGAQLSGDTLNAYMASTGAQNSLGYQYTALGQQAAEQSQQLAQQNSQYYAGLTEQQRQHDLQLQMARFNAPAYNVTQSYTIGAPGPSGIVYPTSVAHRA